MRLLLVAVLGLAGASLHAGESRPESQAAPPGTLAEAAKEEGANYWRKLGDFEGANVGGIADITDTGYQLPSSAMVVPKKRPVYVSGAQMNF